ncbi:MAG TPA: galactose oxidase, partial [Verrucomicrobiae bacterium]|nr:galactose oxidase [Verrucomicrobiae bacterium]
MKRHLLTLVWLGIPLTVAQLGAAVPLMTSYQGRVQVGGANFTGNGQFKFVLVARPGGASLWSNDGTSAN